MVGFLRGMRISFSECCLMTLNVTIGSPLDSELNSEDSEIVIHHIHKWPPCNFEKF